MLRVCPKKVTRHRPLAGTKRRRSHRRLRRSMRIDSARVGFSLVMLVGGARGRPRRLRVQRAWPASRDQRRRGEVDGDHPTGAGHGRGRRPRGPRDGRRWNGVHGGRRRRRAAGHGRRAAAHDPDDDHAADHAGAAALRRDAAGARRRDDGRGERSGARSGHPRRHGRGHRPRAGGAAGGRRAGASRPRRGGAPARDPAARRGDRHD